MVEKYVGSVRLAVCQRTRGGWYSNQLKARVIGSQAKLRKGEVVIPLKLSVPKALLGGGISEVKIDIPDDLSAVSVDQ